MKLDKEYEFLRRMTSCILGTVALAMALAATAGPAGAAAPALSITPGPYHDAQLINVSVGPNHYFKPYSRINIIECGDPGGKARNLPASVVTCDGNTIQGNTILVQRNGSFSERGYQVYALPNASQLGEAPDTRPICNGKQMCVFYIGQNQEKFSAPKIWSPPFTVSKSGNKHS
jgi:hypothetical protein